MTTNEMRNLIEQSNIINNNIQSAIQECLVKMGAIDEEHGVEFDWENSEPPCISSLQFGDDFTDCYITKIWCADGHVMVNLHAFYLGEDQENVDLKCEGSVDYADILGYLICELDEKEDKC